jgi:predicted extracellular nuclease
MMVKIFIILLTVFSMSSNSQSVRIATFNVSMDATNYLESGQQAQGDELSTRLLSDKSQQISNIAEIIQKTRPDIILLNEFDYSNQSATDVQNFIQHYLQVSQNKNVPNAFTIC